MFNQILKSVLLSSLLFSLSASAEPPSTTCNSITKCQVNVANSIASLRVKRQKKLMDIQDQHLPSLNSLTDAMRSCSRIGPIDTYKVPSAREWAEYAQNNGALGILELSFVEKNLNGVVPYSYYIITARNSDGMVDSFYYSNFGYSPHPFILSLDLLRPLYWSSSVESSTVAYAYRFNAIDGAIRTKPYGASTACLGIDVK